MEKTSLESTLRGTALAAALTTGILGGVQKADAATMNIYDGSFSNECKPYATVFDKPENTCIGFEFKDLPSGTLDLRAELPVIDGITSPQNFMWYNPEDDSTSNSFNTIGDEFTFLAQRDSNIKNNSHYGTVAITHGNSGAINSGSDLFTGDSLGYIVELKNGERSPLDINQNFKDSTSVPSPSTLTLLLGGLGAMGVAGAYRRRKDPQITTNYNHQE